MGRCPRPHNLLKKVDENFKYKNKVTVTTLASGIWYLASGIWHLASKKPNTEKSVLGFSLYSFHCKGNSLFLWVYGEDFNLYNLANLEYL